MLSFKLFTVIAFVLISGIIFEDAFAADRAGNEVTPTQPNAHASYNSVTNQVQVDWAFTEGNNAPTTCYLKSDIYYYDNLNDPSANALYDYIPNFTPTYYSSLTSNPTSILAVNQAQYAEVVSCTGTTRIDIDTIMNHALNVNSYTDLQIFLTFYQPNSNGDFDTVDTNRIDEVFVLYSPNIEFDAGTQVYGCGGQIGSTLYVDTSGIHGNNGDNCDGAEFKYLSLNSNQYVDIGMDTSPGLALGATDYGDHVANAFTLLIKVVAQIAAIVTSSGGDDDHNSKPTFAFDHKTFVKLVDNGLVVNGTAFPVTNNYYTPSPMLYLKVGETQNFTSTVFSPNPLTLLEFAFGIPNVGKWTDSEASIVIETNYDGEVLSSEIVKDTFPPVLNATSLESSVSKVKCVADDNSTPCYRVSIEFSFMEPPLGKVFGVQAIDDKRKNTILYFNDGITLEGDSQNPPVTHEIISEIKYKGLQTIQRIDKENDIWITLDKSEPVLKYQQNDHGSFNPIEYRVFEKTPDAMTSNPDRLHSEFIKSIKFEQKRALQYFDSALYLGQLDPSWGHHWKETDRMTEIIDDIEAETKRTQEVFEESYPDYEKTVQNFEE